MHLGYHELRKMLTHFKEEREKRKMAPPPSFSTSSSHPSVSGPGTVNPANLSTSNAVKGPDRDYRSSKDGFRDRERDRDREGGYDRDGRHGSSRHE
jgi:hypothetical protein